MTAKSGRKTSSRTLPPFGDRRRGRIGLLGGSFNPAHDGHSHLSAAALKSLGLDAVWWLVSPQNPVKSRQEMAPLADRLARAQSLAGPRIVATDVERRLKETRSARTLARLVLHYPNVRFVWLMGADNLAQMPKWWRWPQIFRAVRVAVFDRSPYSYKALAGAAAQRFAKARTSRPRTIWRKGPPAWTYIAMRRHPASATALRKAAQY